MTPLMRQYWDIKASHPDKILLFRMGDFFEMFFDDAVKAAPLLGIALTQRNKKSADETPMCGVPYHSISGPINKLLQVGLKVAICDQIEDPKLAKGLVKRAVTRILTPGMVYDPQTLDQSLSNYIACWEDETLACVDPSTGEGFYFPHLRLPDFHRLLSLLPIVEIVLPEGSSLDLPSILVSHHAGKEGMDPSPAVQRLVSYIRSLAGEEGVKTLRPFEARSLQQRLDLSTTVLRHLEIFSNYKGDSQGSFFSAIDRTKTSAGARKLRQWISFPLTDRQDIEQRWDRIQRWQGDMPRLKKLREVLAGLGDLERRLSKVAQPTCNGRDLLSLAHSIHAGLAAVAIDSQPAITALEELEHEISRTLVEDPPLHTKQGHMIRGGFSAELDELISLSTDSQSLLQKMENEEKAKTGISSLKIRYNNVFGYYIEITHTHKDKVPAHYLRKQTLTNAERYCTDELVELEKKVLASQNQRAELEFNYFENLRQKSLALSPAILQLASQCSELDVISSLAWLAAERSYVRPQWNSLGSLTLKGSRHPVVEQTVSFVPNDITLAPQGCLLLTGPNMAGKSTLMRQVALTVILAQMGSFVPATEAQLPLFDHIFTRIGSSDQLSEGFSTFMVEMTETAEMLKKSTAQSLLIIDEIGRGTSTFDGMSLAQAILEYLLERTKALTFFATHYHELTFLENKYPHLKNGHMTVSEKGGEIRFLHTLKAGPAHKSYGIHVARLAGLPAEITSRAEKLLREIETPTSREPAQLSLLPSPDVLRERLDQLETVLQEVQQYPLSSKTPIEALNQVAKWQESFDTLS